MDLSIIIVNWNSVNYLRKCLASIYDQTENITFEIIVVDNASYDGSEEMVKTEFPQVKFVQSAENIGFARANNLGYEYSCGEYLLFLNPDTEILDSAINTMYRCLRSIPDAGLIGCRLVDSDMRLDTSCVQPFPTILNQALDIEYLKTRFPNSRFWKSNPLKSMASDPIEAEVIIGACILIKKNVFEKIGMFSDDYFMYAEDIDLCYKANKAGYKIYFTNEANVIHYGGGATKSQNASDFKILMMRESVLRFIRKYYGGVYGNLYLYSTTLMAVSRIFFIGLSMIINKAFPHRQGLPFAFYKWKKVLRWSVGLERWTKEYYQTGVK